MEIKVGLSTAQRAPLVGHATPVRSAPVQSKPVAPSAPRPGPSVKTNVPAVPAVPRFDAAKLTQTLAAANDLARPAKLPSNRATAGQQVKSVFLMREMLKPARPEPAVSRSPQTRRDMPPRPMTDVPTGQFRSGDLIAQAESQRARPTPAPASSPKNVSAAQVASVRKAIEDGSVGVNTVARRVNQMTVPERASLLDTLSPRGASKLVARMGAANSLGPLGADAYQSLINTTTTGQPSSGIRKLIANALPAGEQTDAVLSPVVHDLATRVATQGTETQRLELIRSLSEPKGRGLVAANATVAEAVGELFKGLTGGSRSADAALSRMSQLDKEAVVRQTLQTDSAPDVAKVFGKAVQASNISQKTQIIEQFMNQVNTVSGDSHREVLNGISGELVKSPNKLLSALRFEDQDYLDNGRALSSYMQGMIESDTSPILKNLMAALKYGDDRGGSRNEAELIKLDSARFNNPDDNANNAAMRGYFVGSFTKMLDGREGNVSKQATENRRLVDAGIAFGSLALGGGGVPFSVVSTLGTGAKYVNNRFNNLQTPDSKALSDTMYSLGLPVVKTGATTRPQTTTDSRRENLATYLNSLEQASGRIRFSK